MFKFTSSSQLLLSVLLFCVIIVLSAYPVEDSEEKIHPCHTDGKAGKCVEIISCPPALKSVRLTTTHNFKRCGFHGVMEVICCPNDFITHFSSKFKNTTERPIDRTSDGPQGVDDRDRPDDNKRLTNRKYVQVCEEYSNEIKPDVTFHILEGEDAEPKEFPHMVALGYNTDTIGEIKWGCGGSLISRLFVLTAAHCIINSDQNPPILAKMGIVKLNDNSTALKPQQYNIVNITIHPEYKKWDKLNDIALIKLNKRVTYTDYVHPACLYDKNDDPTGMIVSGWGDTEIAGEGSNILQKATLTPVPLHECNATYLTRANKNVLTSQICARDNKSDTCQGDSGGPLQVQNIANSSIYSIVGVTSYGIGCGSKYPGIYTRVSSYLDWIENIVWGNS